LQVGVDAGQGNFDAYYPLFYEYLLPYTLAHFLLNTSPSQVTIYFVYGVASLIAMYAMARAVAFSPFAALTGGLLFDVLGLPGLIGHYSQFGANFHANPYWTQDAVACFLAVAAFWSLGGRKLANPITWILVAVPTTCLVWAVASTGAQVIFVVPSAVIYSGGAFFDITNWRKNSPRILALGVAILVTVFTGIIEYYYILIHYSAYQFFSSEFLSVPLSSIHISTFFLTQVGRWTVSFGVIGALWTALRKNGRSKIFAISHLILTAGLFGIGSWLVFLTSDYHGSVPFYFEMFIWPVSLIFCAQIIVGAGVILFGIFKAHFPANRSWWLGRPDTFGLAVLLALVLLLNLGNLARQIPGDCRPGWFRPIQPTVITEYLKKATSLRPSQPFRGITATVDGLQGKSSVNWLDLFSFDANLWAETGNDHRSAGLWRYYIPTMFQYYSFITPPYYLVLSEFLARPSDKQIRSVIVLTKPNPKMMQLWGVKYIITDQNIDFGLEVASIPRLKNAPLRLIELPNANLGGYSPVDVVSEDTARSELAAMHKSSFDPQQTVIVDSPSESGLVPASAVQLIYQKYGFHISAKSDGHSLLVLPVQYSHCWKAYGAGAPVLFRANLMQLGIRFVGSLDARLEFNFGPILASQCRLEDLRDMDRLRISEARATPPESGPLHSLVP
jgi:hypothetical protein